MLFMAAEAFIQCRAPQATKAALRAAAERQQLTESALLKRMLELILHTAGAVDAGGVTTADRPARQARLYVRLTVGDRQLLQERSAARCLAPATYASILLRAHLRALTPLPEAELRALRQSTRELAAIGRNLNQIARATHQGGSGAGVSRARICGVCSKPVRPCATTFARTSAPIFTAGGPAMPRHSPEAYGDGSFLDPVSYGRGVPGQRRQLLPAQIEQIARAVRHTPEVMVKISGGGQSAKAVAAHLKYLSRQEFEIETNDGEHLKGKRSENSLIEDWELNLDAAESRSPYRSVSGCKPATLVHNIVLSMPAGTPAAGVLEASRAFGREQFALKHRYALQCAPADLPTCEGVWNPLALRCVLAACRSSPAKHRFWAPDVP